MRKFLQKMLNFDHIEDFILHEPATLDEMADFVSNKGPGPNLEDLRLDVRGGLSSDWNKKAFLLLRQAFTQEIQGMEDVPPRPQSYIDDLITDSFTRLATEWNRAQPKTSDSGKRETLNEVTKRVNDVKEKAGTTSRHTGRRFAVSEKD